MGVVFLSLFVRVDLGFFTHRKTLRLYSKIGESAFWVPQRLWAYAASQQSDGVFEDYSATEIAMLIGYHKDAQAMLQAMLDCGFLDPNPLRIHDWKEYNGFHAVFSARAKKAAQARWSGQKKEPKKKNREESERRGEEKYQASRSTAPSNASSINQTQETTSDGCIHPIISEKAIQASFFGEEIKGRKKPTREEAASFAIEKHLPASDGEWFVDHCEGTGWKNNGEPIASWRGTFSSWKAQGYFPSQKVNGKQNPSNKRNDGMTNKVTTESGSLIARAAKATINQPGAK